MDTRELAEKRDGMIIVKIKGGLGNQMFQYAMARRFQISYGIDRIGLDLTVIGKDRLRDFGLQHFALFDKVEVVEDKNNRAKLQEDLARRLVSYFIAGRQEGTAGKREDFLAAFFALFGVIQRDHSLVKDKALLRLHKNIYMNGWFQEAEMLQPIRDILLEEFQWKPTEISGASVCRQILSTNAVCVHIRRGDYVNNPIFDVCGDSYYYKAMEYMRGILSNPVFYIFSDAVDELESTMRFPCPVVYVKGGHQDYEDLYLMKNCRHFIMSNSTYSWWAQFLGQAEDKVVVAPKKWCLTEDMSIGVYMKDWVLMDVS